MSKNLLLIKYKFIKSCEKGPINCLCVNYLNFSDKNHFDFYIKCLSKKLSFNVNHIFKK
jgi:hypothetical protein